MSTIVRRLMLETGMREFDVRRLMLAAPARYKIFRIRKRSGGWREIAQPAREIKTLQRALIKTLLADLPVHEAATAYRSGLSILDNALPHAPNGPILKLDLKDFFPSIRSSDWVRYCRDKRLFDSEEDALYTSHLLFLKRPGARNLTLSIGAPSSPILSNILMFDFDEAISKAVASDKVIYTRYADDMTFSAPRTGYLTGVVKEVRRQLRVLDYPSLVLNNEKTTYVTKKYHRSVTGLTLSNDGKVTLGRDKKRLISATVHRAKLNRLSRDQLRILAGMLAYAKAVEPGFIEALARKYGADVIVQIQHAVVCGDPIQAHPPPLATIRRG